MISPSVVQIAKLMYEDLLTGVSTAEEVLEEILQHGCITPDVDFLTAIQGMSFETIANLQRRRADLPEAHVLAYLFIAG
jgi:hypothetical protein